MSWRRLTGKGDAAMDRVAAAALLVLGLVEAALAPTATARPGPQALLTVVWTVPLVWRRRWPVPVLALVVAAGPTLQLVNEEGGVISYVLAAILAVARPIVNHRRGR